MVRFSRVFTIVSSKAELCSMVLTSERCTIMGVYNGVLYFLLKSFGSSFLLGREFAILMTLCLFVCLLMVSSCVHLSSVCSVLLAEI